ncbi:MAG: TetR/AcrR family transcriptional regulator [Actinomycetota bacterium]|nr:TetR/AcrR family transcriptional regulator [Actinomycetota bacterium]
MTESSSLISPTHPAPVPQAPREEQQRLRLMAAMTEAVAAKGYAATTIADVVGRARVSRRTFYEQFADKEDCFLAAYDLAAQMVMGEITGAASRDVAWEHRVRDGIDAYLAGMAREPAVTRVFLVEILAAGPRALARRRQVHERFAALLRALVDAARCEHPRLGELSPDVSLALIAGINELVLVSMESGRLDVPRLRDAASELVRAVIASAVIPAGEQRTGRP